MTKFHHPHGVTTLTLHHKNGNLTLTQKDNGSVPGFRANAGLGFLLSRSEADQLAKDLLAFARAGVKRP